jgi:hypothetical protein
LRAAFSLKKIRRFFGVWQLVNGEPQLANSKRRLANGTQIWQNLGCKFGEFSCRF